MPQLMSYVLSTMGDGVLIIQYDDGDLMSGAVSDVAFLPLRFFLSRNAGFIGAGDGLVALHRQHQHHLRHRRSEVRVRLHAQ
jgi:hypothetical protein